MSSLMVNHVSLGGETPPAVFAGERFFSCVSAEVVPQACPLGEHPVAACDRALVLGLVLSH